MSPLILILGGFIILECTNVVALYLFPGSRYANAIGIFNAWEKSKQDPEIHRFVRYLVNWVAGSKLIFILLLVVIIHTADQVSLYDHRPGPLHYALLLAAFTDSAQNG